MNAPLPKPALPAGKIYVSNGLGIDSLAVLVGLERLGLRPEAIYFADTGSEKNPTYTILPALNAWLRKVGFPEVTVLTKTTREGHPLSLEQHSFRTRRLPAFAYGGASCSLKFKGDRIDLAIRHNPSAQACLARGEKLIRVIGYDASKADRKRAESASASRAKLLAPAARAEVARLRARGTAADLKAAVLLERRIERVERDARENYWWYPLQSWGWTRAECVRQIEAAGLPVPVKSACYFCPGQRPHELLEMALEEPEKAWRILVMEALAMNSHTTDVGLRRSAVQGLRGATAKPAYMSVYLLDWLATGEAFDRWMPELDRKGTALETVAMEHVGALYRKGHLRVIAQTTPDPAALATLRVRGKRLAEALHARALAAGILVEGRVVRFTDDPALKARVAEAAWQEALRLHPSGVLTAPARVRATSGEDEEESGEDAFAA